MPQRPPSHPKNAFLLDRITLERLDPAALEAQLDTWRAESDGSTLYLRSIALLESVLATRRPDKTHLLPNYPNPFNPETWIPYHLANPSQVEITIYDTGARLSATSIWVISRRGTIRVGAVRCIGMAATILVKRCRVVSISINSRRIGRLCCGRC